MSSTRRRLGVALSAFVALGAALVGVVALEGTSTSTTLAAAAVRPSVNTPLTPPPGLGSRSANLSAAPFAVPVVLEIPRIHVLSQVLSVGMTSAHVMAAPEGGATSPYWGDTFWYRGGSVPGAVGTATIAGHIDDRYGRYAVFGLLSTLRRGDLIVMHFTRRHLSERFVVTGLHDYTLAQTTTRPVLNLIYGTGPPAGRPPARSADGLAHLSLITCAGTWDYSLATHNERLVVSAVRVR